MCFYYLSSSFVVHINWYIIVLNRFNVLSSVAVAVLLLLLPVSAQFSNFNYLCISKCYWWDSHGSRRAALCQVCCFCFVLPLKVFKAWKCRSCATSRNRLPCGEFVALTAADTPTGKGPKYNPLDCVSPLLCRRHHEVPHPYYYVNRVRFQLPFTDL